MQVVNIIQFLLQCFVQYFSNDLVSKKSVEEDDFNLDDLFIYNLYTTYICLTHVYVCVANLHASGCLFVESWQGMVSSSFLSLKRQ